MADNAIAARDNDAPRQDPLKQIARSPAARQALLLVAIAAAVALGVAVVLWSRGPNYGLLYAGLDQKDAAAVAQELQAGNTPFQLSADGSSIMAPAADLAGLRLKLASKGLPRGSASSSSKRHHQRHCRCECGHDGRTGGQRSCGEHGHERPSTRARCDRCDRHGARRTAACSRTARIPVGRHRAGRAARGPP